MQIVGFLMHRLIHAVFLFIFLGMGAGPLKLGKITREMPKLGKSCDVKFFLSDSLFNLITYLYVATLSYNDTNELTFSQNLYIYFSISQYL